MSELRPHPLRPKHRIIIYHAPSRMKYIFGYGSLMNRIVRARMLPGDRDVRTAILIGYQRKINARVGNYLYLNLIPNPEKQVSGVLVLVTESEFELFRRREIGYSERSVGGHLTIPVAHETMTFVAPDRAYPGFRIPLSYLKTCMREMTQEEQNLWLAETIIENEIFDDRVSPVYTNVII